MDADGRIRELERKLGELREAMRAELSDLDKTVGNLQRDQEIMSAAVETRLDNGRKVFSAIDERLTRLEPKPISAGKVAGITLSVALAALGAMWALANEFRDRPTLDQIEKVMERHDVGGHPTTRDDITEAKTLILQVKEAQEKMDGKLDEALAPAPEGKRRR